MPQENGNSKVTIIPAESDGPLGYHNCGDLQSVKKSDSSKIRDYVNRYAFILCAAQIILDKRYGKGHTKAFIARNTDELLPDGRVALDIVHAGTVNGLWGSKAQHTTVPIETVERLVERMENGEIPDDIPTGLPLGLPKPIIAGPALAEPEAMDDSWRRFFKAPFWQCGVFVFDGDNNPVLQIRDGKDDEYTNIIAAIIHMLNNEHVPNDDSVFRQFDVMHSSDSTDSFITITLRCPGEHVEPPIYIDIRGWGHLTGTTHGLDSRDAAKIQDSFGKYIASFFKVR